MAVITARTSRTPSVSLHVSRAPTTERLRATIEDLERGVREELVEAGEDHLWLPLDLVEAGRSLQHAFPHVRPGWLERGVGEPDSREEPLEDGVHDANQLRARAPVLLQPLYR